jgi:hypothetical protein
VVPVHILKLFSAIQFLLHQNVAQIDGDIILPTKF